MNYFVPTALTPVQNTVILSLSSGASISAAAEAAGVGRTTVYSWLTKPEFAEAIQHARADRIIALRDELNDAAMKAIRTLVAVMDDPRASATARVKAALAILNRPDASAEAWKLPEPVHPEAVHNAEETLQKADFDETQLNTSEHISQISEEESHTPTESEPILDASTFNFDALTFDNFEIEDVLRQVQELTQKSTRKPEAA